MNFTRLFPPEYILGHQKEKKKKVEKPLEAQRWMGRGESHTQNYLFPLSGCFALSNIPTHNCKYTTVWKFG